MAGSKRYADLIFRGDSRDAETAIDRVSNAGGRMGSAIRGAATVAAGGLALLGGAAIKFGNDFQQSRSAIAVATGATGDDLDELYGTFKDTLGRVPDDMGTVADAIGVANTLFGATGDGLADLTERTLDFSRLAGGEAAGNMELLGQTASIFGLGAEDATVALDDLFRVTQNYNISGDALLSMMQTFGPIFSNAGFSMQETATIMGQLHAAGIDLSRVGPALNRFFREVADAGGDPQTALADIEASIRGAASSTDALNIATDAFGAEGAQRMVSAIRDGNVQLSDLEGLLGDNTGLIGDTASATATLGEKWNEFKNGVLVQLEPVIMTVFDAFERLMDSVTHIADNFQTYKPIIIGVGVALGVGLVGALGAATVAWWGLNSAALATAAPFVAAGVALAGLVAGLVWAYDNVEWFRSAVDGLVGFFADNWEPTFNAARDIVVTVFAKIAEVVEPLVSMFVDTIDLLSALFRGDFARVWDEFKSIVANGITAVVAYFREFPGTALSAFLGTAETLITGIGRWIVDTAAPQIGRWLTNWSTQFVVWVGSIPGLITSGLADLGERIWEAIQAAWDYVLERVKGLSPIDLPSIDLPGLPFGIGGGGGGSSEIVNITADKTAFPSKAGKGNAVFYQQSAASAVGGLTPQSAGTGGDIVLQVDGQAFARVSRKAIIESDRTNGPIPVRVR